MQPETKIQENSVSIHSPETEELSGTEGTSTRHLIAYVLALIFILIAGSTALYRYMQRMDNPPKARHAWTLRENIVSPSTELLSTSFRCSVIKNRLECPSCATKPISQRSSCTSSARPGS